VALLPSLNVIEREDVTDSELAELPSKRKLVPVVVPPLLVPLASASVVAPELELAPPSKCAPLFPPSPLLVSAYFFNFEKIDPLYFICLFLFPRLSSLGK